MGGNGSSSKKKSGGGGGTMSGPQAVDEVLKLKRGSEIQITYDTGSGTVTDTFRLQSKNYALAGRQTAWVNQTQNGWQNDFIRNKTTLEGIFRNRKVKITKRV